MSDSKVPSRRPKRFLSAEQKYELWLKVLTGELTSQQAALEAGVDRTTIMTLRKVAKDGAIAALQASKPGRRGDAAAERFFRPRADRARRSISGGAGRNGTRRLLGGCRFYHGIEALTLLPDSQLNLRRVALRAGSGQGASVCQQTPD